MPDRIFQVGDRVQHVSIIHGVVGTVASVPSSGSVCIHWDDNFNNLLGLALEPDDSTMHSTAYITLVSQSVLRVGDRVLYNGEPLGRFSLHGVEGTVTAVRGNQADVRWNLQNLHLAHGRRYLVFLSHAAQSNVPNTTGEEVNTSMEKGTIRNVTVNGFEVKAILVRVPRNRGGKYGYISYAKDDRLGERIFYV